MTDTRAHSSFIKDAVHLIITFWTVRAVQALSKTGPVSFCPLKYVVSTMSCISSFSSSHHVFMCCSLLWYIILHPLAFTLSFRWRFRSSTRRLTMQRSSYAEALLAQQCPPYIHQQCVRAWVRVIGRILIRFNIAERHNLAAACPLSPVFSGLSWCPGLFRTENLFTCSYILKTLSLTQDLLYCLPFAAPESVTFWRPAAQSCAIPAPRHNECGCCDGCDHDNNC